ncbi:hypothetical protein J6590_033874 [Homalodisca vitripennis]|nr:hypothetical protein J6590_033874 [Homalodisca vitripennis]
MSRCRVTSGTALEVNQDTMCSSADHTPGLMKDPQPRGVCHFAPSAVNPSSFNKAPVTYFTSKAIIGALIIPMNGEGPLAPGTPQHHTPDDVKATQHSPPLHTARLHASHYYFDKLKSL